MAFFVAFSFLSAWYPLMGLWGETYFDLNPTWQNTPGKLFSRNIVFHWLLANQLDFEVNLSRIWTLGIILHLERCFPEISFLIGSWLTNEVLRSNWLESEFSVPFCSWETVFPKTCFLLVTRRPISFETNSAQIRIREARVRSIVSLQHHPGLI